MAKQTPGTEELAQFIGLRLTEVRHEEPGKVWVFRFGKHEGRRGEIQLACPWKLIAKTRGELASGDHGQRYGLPKPIDAAALILELVGQHEVRHVEIDPVTADMTIGFAGHLRLTSFSDATGYEPWEFRAPGGAYVVAQGHGDVFVFELE